MFQPNISHEIPLKTSNKNSPVFLFLTATKKFTIKTEVNDITCF